MTDYKRRRSWWQPVMAAVLAAIVFPAVFADESDKDIELLTNLDFPAYIDDTSPNGGLFTDIIRESFAAVGMNLEIRVMPWKRAIDTVRRGEAIGTFSWGFSKQRQQTFHLSDPIFLMADIIYTRLETFHSLEELQQALQAKKNAAICLPLGWTVAPGFQKLVKRNELIHLAPGSTESCIAALATGRVDVTYLPRFSAQPILKKAMETLNVAPADIAKLSRLNDLPFIRNTSHLLFHRSPQAKKYRDLFNAGLAEIVRNGRFEAVVEMHLAHNRTVSRSQVFADLAEIGLVKIGSN